jgi:hypothetical protein
LSFCKLILCIAAVFAITTPAMAADSLVVYRATHDACWKLMKMPKPVADQWLMRGQVPSSVFIRDVIQPLILTSAKEAFADLVVWSSSSALVGVLQDEGFKKALDECYGDNESSKQDLRKVLAAADLKGKTLAGFGMLATGSGMSAVLGRLAIFNARLARAVTVGTIAVTVRGIYFEIQARREIKQQIVDRCGSTPQEQSTCLRESIQNLTAGYGGGEDSLDGLALALTADIEKNQRELLRLDPGSDSYLAVNETILRESSALKVAREQKELLKKDRP